MIPSKAKQALLHLLGIATLVLACSSDEESPRPMTGSETHFLSWCDAPGTCGNDLDCVCGACTEACSAGASCAAHSALAQCVSVDVDPGGQVCAEAEARTACEFLCSVNADCASLSEEHRCDRGVCRRLAETCTTGQISGNEVALLGDSFIADTHRITGELEVLARETGALGGDEEYRDYSSVIITPFGGNADLTTQYASARAEGTPRIVIMDVGGPDALGACPDPPTPECPALVGALDGAEALWQQMATDGVEAVVDFFYPDSEDSTLNAKFDVLRPLIQAACESSPVECYFVDLRPAFEGRSEQYLLPGGILPTDAGSITTAALVFSVMQQHCLAQ